MSNTDIVKKICEKIIPRLKAMGYEEDDEKKYTEKLIFPNKVEQDKKNKKRISEQELRLLFIEQFKTMYDNLYYSIETPTKNKYNLSGDMENFKHSNNQSKINGQSALIDMCIFEFKDKKKYNRILNIEFKHGNVHINHIAKDIYKLIHEKEDGAFILLLENTNKGTLINNNKDNNRSGVVDKIRESFSCFLKDPRQKNKKIIIVIISLESDKKPKYCFYDIDLENFNPKNRSIENNCRNLWMYP